MYFAQATGLEVKLIPFLPTHPISMCAACVDYFVLIRHKWMQERSQRYPSIQRECTAVVAVGGGFIGFRRKRKQRVRCKTQLPYIRGHL